MVHSLHVLATICEGKTDDGWLAEGEDQKNWKKKNSWSISSQKTEGHEGHIASQGVSRRKEEKNISTCGGLLYFVSVEMY